MDEPTMPRVGGATPDPTDDYLELTRIVSYGETLHTERQRFWVTIHTAFTAFLAITIGDQPLFVRSTLCSVGIVLCLCWIPTVWRISRRLNLLSGHIEERFPNSPYGFWMRYFRPPSPAGRPRWKGVATFIFTYVVPGLFLLAYILLWTFGGKRSGAPA